MITTTFKACLMPTTCRASLRRSHYMHLAETELGPISSLTDELSLLTVANTAGSLFNSFPLLILLQFLKRFHKTWLEINFSLLRHQVESKEEAGRDLRTFAPKSSYGVIFFISPLELVHKVLTPKLKKKMGVTDFVSEKMAVEKCLNLDKSGIITRCSLLC